MGFIRRPVISLLVCPHATEGANAQFFRCKTCIGMNMGHMVRSNFLYFGRDMSAFGVRLRRARQYLYGVECVLTILCIVGFLGAGLYQLLIVPEFGNITSAGMAVSGDQDIVVAFMGALIFFLYGTYLVLSHRKKIELVEREAFMNKEPVSQDLLHEENQEWPYLTRTRKKKNIAATFTSDALNVVDNAFAATWSMGAKEPTIEQVFLALLAIDRVRILFVRLGVTSKLLGEKLPLIRASIPRGKDDVDESGIHTIFDAYEIAYEAHDEMVDVTDLLVAVVAHSETLQELLYEVNIDQVKLDNVVEWVRIRERLRRQYQKFQHAATHVSKHGIDRAMTAVATPFLNSFSQNLTLAAKLGYIAPVVARDEEIREIFRIVDSGRQSVVLVGDMGVGKRSLIDGVIMRMVEGRAPKRLLDKRVVQLSTTALLAGTTVRGAQERLQQIMHEILRARNIILYIENIHELIGGNEGLDVAGALAEYLGDSDVLLFATTTPDGYKRSLANSAMGSMLAKVLVGVMSENMAIQVLESKAGSLEYKHGVFFVYDAIAACVSLAKRFLHDQYLPDSALQIMGEAASFVRSKRGARSFVTPDDVGQVISQKTGVPATSITQDESEKLLRLEEEMHKRVIGQEEAVSLVANALRRSRAEVRSTKRPIANFLFLGPTGVGKTELAKTIASVYFGGEDQMIRIDMSEFQDTRSIYRLIGEPGVQGTGLLTEAVRQRPFSLLLLDEIEKAHPDILNLFLQVLDDGRITDSIGRVIDFTSTIIIATSNAGTAFVTEALRQGRDLKNINDALLHGELKKYFRPEFLNRFDAVVLFHPLSREHLVTVAGLMLEGVQKELEKRGVTVRLDPGALEYLADKGYDPEFGARPMRRTIQELVENAVARFILQGKLNRRDVVVIGGRGEVSVETG